MNHKLIKLFEKSNLNKAEFSKKIGIQKQNLNKILDSKFILKPATYEKYYSQFLSKKRLSD